VHGHCHAKALADARGVIELIDRLPGASARWLETGCCGMAGAFGMLKAHRELSHQVAVPLVEAITALPPNTTLVASGTSCRHQITDLTNARPMHLAELLASSLRDQV
jgi:Fe-S oxidoreductase